MNKVPAVSDRDMDDLSESALQVTSLAVDLSTNQSVCSLVLGAKEFGKPDGRRIELALSPPAAARLSRLLAQAVEEHLYGDDAEASRTG